MMQGVLEGPGAIESIDSDVWRGQGLWDGGASSPIPVWNTKLVRCSFIFLPDIIGIFLGDGLGVVRKNLFEEGKIWSMPGREYYGAMSAITTVVIALDVIPSLKWSAIYEVQGQHCDSIKNRPFGRCIGRQD